MSTTTRRATAAPSTSTARSYDCRRDKRIWIDYEQRIPAPAPHGHYDDKGQGAMIDLVQRAQARSAAIKRESMSISETYADAAPQPGSPPQPIVKPVR